MGSEQPKEKKRQKPKPRKKQYKKKKEDKWEFQGQINCNYLNPLIEILILEVVVLVLSLIAFTFCFIAIKTALEIFWGIGIFLSLLWLVGETKLMNDYPRLSIFGENLGRNFLIAISFLIALTGFSVNMDFTWSVYYGGPPITSWLHIPILIALFGIFTLSLLTGLSCLEEIRRIRKEKNESPVDLWLKNIEEGDWWE